MDLYGDFSRKSQHFPSPSILRPRWRGSPWNWVQALGVKKTRVMGLPGRQRSLTISSAVWIECTNVTDRRTDRRTPGHSEDRAYAYRRAVKTKKSNVSQKVQEAQLIQTNPRDAFRGQSRSSNVVPFDMLGTVSCQCAMVTLSVRRTVFETAKTVLTHSIAR